jgi:DNA primase
MPRFSPEFLDELKSRLRPSDVIGRTVKLKKRGDTWWGLSPFKEERTPSFTVSDRRGSYHCFATAKHGNIFDFLIETQGLSFPEAVERLAAEAGVPLPVGDPRDAERAEKRRGLIEACEAAAAFFQAMLRRTPGRAGAEYLARREVLLEAIAEFRLGYAPDDGRALKDHLLNKGFGEDVLIEAGLIARPDDGGATYDRFRARVMFPICGTKGEVIAFGGRSLDPEARAKYLNSPETPLFHKGDVLYNFGPAREVAAAAKEPIIVCEGYMDVIGLWGAGFHTAVAPLGTALTEAQLQLLWRQVDEPVLCFDGDAAGLGAAYRSLDRALPRLKPGKSLRYVFLPEGQDPDDVVRAGGARAFKAFLDSAVPLAEVLWRRECETRPLDTPERRAALRAGLRELVGAIADKDVRRAYGAEMAQRLNLFFAGPEVSSAGPRPRRADKSAARWPRRPRSMASELEMVRASPILKRRGVPSSWRREATLLLAIVNHPRLFERQESGILALRCENPDLGQLLHEIIETFREVEGLDTGQMKGHLQRSAAGKTLERVLRDETLRRQIFLRPDAELDEVEAGWSDALRHHLLATEARQTMSEAAARSVTTDEEGWRAAVIAREELKNAGSGENRAAGDGDDPPFDVADRLEEMRKSVAARRKR